MTSCQEKEEDLCEGGETPSWGKKEFLFWNSPESHLGKGSKRAKFPRRNKRDWGKKQKASEGGFRKKGGTLLRGK